MRSVRPPAVAGTFYPGDPATLSQVVRRLLDAARPPPLGVEPRIVIVPHAGYIYSGPVAATAYVAIDTTITARVLLIGPSHFARFVGLALPGAAALRTPLGDVAVDTALTTLAAPYAVEDAGPHRREHSLEVQLPFLQTVAPASSCLPVLTGDDDPEPAAQLVELAASRTDVTIVVSSDLSHYLDHEAATLVDAETAAAIEKLDEAALGPGSACGRTAVRGAMRAAARLNWRCELLDLRTSGDTQGDRSRVVGYGAFALGPGAGT